MKGAGMLPGQTEQVEQLAQRIWSQWLTVGDTIRIAERLGYSKNQFGFAARLDGLKWKGLPDKLKEHIRGMAEEELKLIQGTQQTEVTRYLVTLFRELERLHPNVCGAMSHGIAWDHKRERLVLLVNLGDCVHVHRLRPDDLIKDPVATASNLMAKVKPELSSNDTELIIFKR